MASSRRIRFLVVSASSRRTVDFRDAQQRATRNNGHYPSLRLILFKYGNSKSQMNSMPLGAFDILFAVHRRLHRALYMLETP